MQQSVIKESNLWTLKHITVVRDLVRVQHKNHLQVSHKDIWLQKQMLVRDGRDVRGVPAVRDGRVVRVVRDVRGGQGVPDVRGGTCEAGRACGTCGPDRACGACQPFRHVASAFE